MWGATEVSSDGEAKYCGCTLDSLVDRWQGDTGLGLFLQNVYCANPLPNISQRLLIFGFRKSAAGVNYGGNVAFLPFQCFLMPGDSFRAA